MLQGGLPENRNVLLAGGPGTGKTTLGMQYLQAGIERGESCLFVSTEQTPGELRDSLDPYRFDLDDEHLTLTTVHASPGAAIESDEDILTLDVLGRDTSGPRTDGAGTSSDNSAVSFGGYGRPFTSENVLEFLRQYAPRDRVVFDSVSGLSAMADDSASFQRCVLDLFRLFTDEFDATTILTAEDPGDSRSNTAEMLQYNSHGVIELRQEPVDGDYHRFLRVAKMRGVDHSTKPYELELDADGAHLVPKTRTKTSGLRSYEYFSTGIGGLDKLTGGGLIQGSTALLEHDGRAAVDALVTSLLVEALRSERAILLVPPSNMSADALDETLGDRVAGVQTLMDDDRLFVLDLIGTWDRSHKNIFGIGSVEQHLRDLFGSLKPLVSWRVRRTFRQIDERRGDRDILIATFTESMLQEFDPEEVRDIYHWGNRSLRDEDDTVLFVQNPDVMADTLAEFFVYDAQQLLRTWSHTNGLQYVKLEKSPTGRLGSTRLVESIDYPPYVRVQRPHGPSIDTSSSHEENP